MPSHEAAIAVLEDLVPGQIALAKQWAETPEAEEMQESYYGGQGWRTFRAIEFKAWCALPILLGAYPKGGDFRRPNSIPEAPVWVCRLLTQLTETRVEPARGWPWREPSFNGGVYATSHLQRMAQKEHAEKVNAAHAARDAMRQAVMTLILPCA